MLRSCKLPAARLSTEPQTRKGPPAFKGRTALGADDLAKGDAYGASIRPDVANVLQQTKLGAALMDGMARTITGGDGAVKPKTFS